jgi:mannose-6-phosphate isomerase-like protein (cupin superfamily)
MQEQPAWGEHAAFMNGLAEAGFIVLGGTLGDGQRVLHIVEADSANAVRQLFAADPWEAMCLLRTENVESWRVLLDRDATEQPRALDDRAPSDRMSMPGPMKAINLAEKLAKFTEYYKPRTVGEFNGHDLMVVKVKGPFTWHKHDDTDDFFLVLKGRLTIQMRDGDVHLQPGEMFVVPKGIEHCPVANEETHILLIEPSGTPNTGNAATAAERVVI